MLKLSSPLSRWSKGIVVTSAIVGVIIIVLEAVVAHIYNADVDLAQLSNDRSIFVYLMIFIFAQIFQLFLILDAVIAQNLIQVIAHFLFNFCIAVYSIFQYQQLASASSDEATNLFPSLQPYLIAIMCVALASLACFAYFTYKLYQEFGWKIYKKIGADPRMKLRYRNYQIFLMMLKVDFFFFIAFSVQFLVLVLRTDDFELYLTIAAIPLSAAFLYLAAHGLRNEKKWIIYAFLVAGVIANAYFIFKLYRFYDPTQAEKYVASQKFLTFFASICLLAIIGTMVNAVVCLQAFDKGLKDRIDRQKANKPERNMTL